MIKILKPIYSILSNDVNIQALVGDKIFPDTIPDKDDAGIAIPNPVILIERTAIDMEYAKGCAARSIASITVTCWADSYFQAADIIDAVNTALELYKGTVEGISIDSIKLESGTEGYVGKEGGSYYQQLVYNIR